VATLCCSPDLLGIETLTARATRLRSHRDEPPPPHLPAPVRHSLPALDLHRGIPPEAATSPRSAFSTRSWHGGNGGSGGGAVTMDMLSERRGSLARSTAALLESRKLEQVRRTHTHDASIVLYTRMTPCCEKIS
jgi:hypothetical protein